MEIQKYLGQMKIIQERLLDFLDSERDNEENYQNLIILLGNQKNQDVFESIINLISKISFHHHRSKDFFSKIEKILLFLKKDIEKFFTKSDIIRIFYKSRRMILFFIQENYFEIQDLYGFLKKKKYYEQQIEVYMKFFAPEFAIFKNENNDENQIEDFNQKRIIGENDYYIAELIRNDSIEEYISYSKKDEIMWCNRVPSSIFETNIFLYKKFLSIIEYAAFFGSTQIFKYMYLNGEKLTQDLWLYAVHGNNQEIFEILKENNVEPDEECCKECFKEAVKCHHNEMVNYFIKNNYVDEEFLKSTSDYKNNFDAYRLHYYNFAFFPEKIEEMSPFYLIHYNYFSLVKLLLENDKFDLNKEITIVEDNSYRKRI
ncbi:hypothetical protein M9Y10_027690 [Tritrichomonas musculus]|uniref:DUF3447 domain-containing protein n=1 Tax=Tritrichomonas musculus TaxID=1915356 RepID=A0ABR2H3T9_9EUKA